MNIITIEQAVDKETSVLKKIAEKITFPLSQEDKYLIGKMEKILYELEGVGLAAPQVGVAKRIALVYIPESASLLRENATVQPMHVIINPEYWPNKDSVTKQDFEACYSVDTVAGKVPRSYSIRVKYQNEEGATIDKIVDGFYARVLQHEIDHLNGILITDRLTPECIQGNKKAMLKIRRQELSEEKRQQLDGLLKQKGIEILDDQ
ncbi:MAG: polypeptide deformylase [Gammaproteobacteria bacterium]|jgi:peptide deformylase|nr:polypeptide deformylase [Gammaproteobacteria bacterium]